MKKMVSTAFGKKQFLLGVDKSGIYYWLQESSFDCGWYWSIGYIETFTSNNNPSRSRDINSHQHFDSMMKHTGKHHNEAFNMLFNESVLTENEIWEFLEIMDSLYIMRNYSDLLHRGCSGISQNKNTEIIKSDVEYKRINECVIPSILKRLYSILSPECIE